MKKIVAIFLVSLLGFLGCSDSDDGITTVGKAIPVAPFGIIETPNPTYEWTPVPGATKYRLTVQDTNQEFTTQNTQETAIIDEWCTAEEAECASEDRLCMLAPDTEVIGKHEFMVQACINENCGVWRELLHFDFTPMNEPRFTDNGDDTVTDNKTKLMWTKNANLYDDQEWNDDWNSSNETAIGGYTDWRLPSITELRSLIDINQFDPALPPGNPFMYVKSLLYWSSTACGSGPYYAWLVDMEDGSAHFANKDCLYYVWPARSGN